MLCKCGCGNSTTRVPKSNRNRGLVKGEFHQYIRGHNNAKRPSRGRDLESPIIVDPADEEELKRHRWHVVETSPGKFYVTCSMKDREGMRRTTYLHRHLMNARKGEEVDHINGNGLDNRRANLRIASRAENCRNTRRTTGKSGFRGVYATRNKEKWQCRINHNGSLQYIGTFSSAIEAAKAYDNAARRMHGEFALLNFPEDGERSGRSTRQR